MEKTGWILKTKTKMYGSFDHLYYSKAEALDCKKIMDSYSEKLEIIKCKITLYASYTLFTYYR